MKSSRANGFVLPMTIFLLMGVTAIAVGIMFNGKMGRMSAVNYKNKVRSFLAADGMVTLLAQELINGNAYKYVDTTRTGRIRGEVWYGDPSSSVDHFEKVTTKSVPHSDTLSSPYLGTNLNKMSYGVKLTGWLIPPHTGAYTFITRSDDESRFYLSTDAEQSHMSAKPICRIEPGWVVDWPTTGTGVSAPIPLEAGHRYYFEYYQKQGDGWDVGQVGWSGPEFFSERPISGQYLSQYKSDPEWSGTAMAGNVPVRYSLTPMGLDAFRIGAQSNITRPGKTSDTAYRANLTQTISLKGPPIPAPPKLALRVIYYDYPSGGVYPEFDTPAPHIATVFQNMVQSTFTDSTPVDAAYFGRAFIPKPTRGTPAPNFGCGVNEWFRYWPPVAPNTKDYRYRNPATGMSDPKDCALKTIGARTYTNARYYDSLLFDLDESQGPYTYVFSRMGNVPTANPQTSFRGEAQFFPLDFLPNDPPALPHNFSFCMELHTTFLHQSGLKLEFTGDDDVWAYVNNKLVIDLGGIHDSQNSILNLDDMTGMSYGKTYPLDLFQCERHTFSSTSRIVTNIKMGRPQGKPVTNWRRDYGTMN